MTSFKSTKKLVKAVLDKLNQMPGTFETLQQITLDFFGENIFAEFRENGITSTITYQQMYAKANDVRNNLLIKHRDKDGVVILKMENSPNWYIAFWGIVAAGFKPVLVDPKIEKINEIFENVAIVDIIDDQHINEYLIQQEQQPIVTYATELAFLSSGTTDIPKIISYDVNSLKAQIRIASEILRKNAMIRNGNKLVNANKIKVLAFLPLFHIFGFMVIVIWFSFFGRTIVFLENITSKTIQYTCQEHHVTHFFAVPLVWETIVNNIFAEAKKQNKLDKLNRAIKISNCLQNICPKLGIKITRNLFFKNIRKEILGNDLIFLISGGAAINKKYLSVLNGLGYAIHNGYGLTESGIVSVELSKYVKYRNLETVGKPFKNIQWQITKQKELQLKSDLLFKNKMLHGQLTTNNQNDWYGTIDIVQLKKKRLKILGRLDDAIIGGDGENVYPEELENLFNVSPFYTCGILGIKQRSGSHQINLLVCFKKNITPVLETELVKKIYQIVEMIPLYKKPIKFYAVDQLPLTNLGKVKHKQLLEMYEQHQLNLVPLTKNIENNLQFITNETTKKLLLEVRQCFAKIFNVDVDTIHDNTNFITDLGGSSIDYYGILNEISTVTKKEIKLIGQKVLLTPLDFVIYILNN